MKPYTFVFCSPVLDAFRGGAGDTNDTGDKSDTNIS
jgi:hypothetical protein